MFFFSSQISCPAKKHRKKGMLVIIYLLTQKGISSRAADCNLSDLFAEPESLDHLPRHSRDLHEVVRRPGCHVFPTKDHLFRNSAPSIGKPELVSWDTLKEKKILKTRARPSAKSHSHLILQVASAVKAGLEPLLARSKEGETTRLPTWNDRDLGHRIIFRHQRTHQSMSRLCSHNHSSFHYTILYVYVCMFFLFFLFVPW